MDYHIHIYNPANHTHIVPAIAATNGIGNAISIAQVLAKHHDEHFCVVSSGRIIAFVQSPSSIRADEDDIENILEPYDGVPADTGSV